MLCVDCTRLYLFLLCPWLRFLSAVHWTIGNEINLACYGHDRYACAPIHNKLRNDSFHTEFHPTFCSLYFWPRCWHYECGINFQNLTFLILIMIYCLVLHLRSSKRKNEKYIIVGILTKNYVRHVCQKAC